jgi:hypothetical protein
MLTELWRLTARLHSHQLSFLVADSFVVKVSIDCGGSVKEPCTKFISHEQLNVSKVRNMSTILLQLNLPLGRAPVFNLQPAPNSTSRSISDSPSR